MKKVNIVSVVELEQRINSLQSGAIISFTSLTEPAMRKTGNPYVGRVKKVQTMNAVINFEYENVVNNRLDKEEKEKDFKVADNWGSRTEESKAVIEHKGVKYLQVMPTNPSKPEYLLDGNTIEKSVIEAYLYAPSTTSRQGLEKENQVVIRRFKFENIVKVNMLGEEFLVR